MKKLQVYLASFKRRALIILIILEVFSVALTAQDAVVLEINSPMEMVYVNEGVDLSVTLGNIGEVPIFDGVVFMQVFYGTDIVHEYFIPISILQPNSEMMINSAPDSWVPFMSGLYLFRAEVQFHGDLDLSNNMVELEFSAIEQPIDYYIEQVNMHSPFQIDNSMYGIFQMNYLAHQYISYANVMAWNPLDGNVGWIVRNFPLIPHENPQVLDYWFDFSMLGYVEGMDIPEIGVSVMVTSQIVLEPWSVEMWQLHPVLDYDYEILSINPTEAIEVYPPAEINYISYTPITYANWEFRGCEVPDIDEDSLPIHVKCQSWWLKNESFASSNPIWEYEAEDKNSTSGVEAPTWEFLKSEMDKGEDVEILFGWYDENGKRHGGHWVTASGYYEDNNTSGIFIKDDGDQNKAGGTRQIYHDWIRQGEWSRLGGYHGPHGYCWIESIVSKSLDTTIIFPNAIERVNIRLLN